MQPRVCDMNINKDGSQKSLADEPGIQELMRLYLDDKYDYSNGTFTGMSEETEKQFRKDLKLFYTAFTGNQEMPDNIQKFSDIKLRDYNKKPGCQQPTSILKDKYTLNKKDDLYVKYAENIKKMIQTAADNQYKLLDVINELFAYVNDPYSGKRVIRINPKLTDNALQKAVEKTRKLIIDLYIKCETDYVNGVQLFEAIVESKIVETTQKQIETLKKEAAKIISDTKKASEPVKQPAVVIVKNDTSTSSATSSSSSASASASDSSSSSASASDSSSTINSNITSSIPYSTNTIKI
jgi:ribosomal protein L17